MGDISARDYAFDLAAQIDGAVDFGNDTSSLVSFLLNATGRQIDKASTLTTVTVSTTILTTKNYNDV